MECITIYIYQNYFEILFLKGKLRTSSFVIFSRTQLKNLLVYLLSYHLPYFNLSGNPYKLQDCNAYLSTKSLLILAKCEVLLFLSLG